MRGSLTFWIVVLVLPVVALVGNSLMRWLHKRPQSATADMVLIFVLFDFVILIEPAKFQPFVSIELIRDNLVGVYAVMTFFTFILWTVCISRIEPLIDSYYVSGTGRFAVYPFKAMFITLLVAASTILVNVSLFAWGM